jgi:DNA-binding CsgD family transcriptional regulator
MAKKPIVTPFDTLTKREIQVAKLLGCGSTNRAMGKTLGISPRTVEVHRAHMLKKLGIRRVKDLKALAKLHKYSLQFQTEFPHTSSLKRVLTEQQAELLIPADLLHQIASRLPIQRPPDRDAKYLMDEVLDSLRGATIIEPVWSPGYMCNDYVGLSLRRPDSSVVTMWIDRDPGANGPGWVRVEPLP